VQTYFLGHPGGRRLQITPDSEIGQGNEAYVYRVGSLAIKIYKQPDDPSYDTKDNPDREREVAKERLELAAKKLLAFPKNLPSRIVAPKELVYDAYGKVVGFAMDYLEDALMLKAYTAGTFQEAQGVNRERIVELFRDLHATVEQAHDRGFVFADFTPMNNMVTDWIRPVDADAGQYGRFLTDTFTQHYVDPRHCDPNKDEPMLIVAHNQSTDWYAWHAMFFEVLTGGVKPFGGTFRSTKELVVLDVSRPLKRISVFDERVRYPKAGVQLDAFPGKAMEYFRSVFEQDVRGPFPPMLFEMLLTGKPGYQPTPVQLQAVVVQGKVTANLAFKTSGVIVSAVVQDGILRVIYHENGKYLRENNRPFLTAPKDYLRRFRIQGDKTMIGEKNYLTIVDANGQTLNQYVIDAYENLVPQFDGNPNHAFWIQGNTLMQQVQFGSKPVGSIIPGRTYFWVGPTFGFGIYRVGGITRAFVFDAEKPVLDDRVAMPQINGQLIDLTCSFTSNLAWFFYSLKEGSEVRNYCYVVKSDSTIVASAQAVEGDGSWLGRIRGGFATGNSYFAPTDRGIVRVEVVQDTIQLSREYPDTDEFVNSQTLLLPASDGIYAVHTRSVQLLTIR